MSDTVIYLIRHSDACAKSNFKNIKNSDTVQIYNEKSLLSVSGEKKAEAMSKIDELHNIDAVYSSNYVRALSTAKYVAQENNTIINIDDRFGERKIGVLGSMDWMEFYRNQTHDFDFKLHGGESLNQTKKRMIEAIKNVLMFESGNRVAIVSHSTAITCLLSAWCDIGHNYNDEIILSYNEETIVDGHFEAPMIFKITFDGMNVKNIECLNIKKL